MRVVHLSTIHQALDVRIFEKECRTLAAHGYEVYFVVNSPPCDRKSGVTFWPIEISPTASKLQQVWQRYASACSRALQLNAEVYHFHDTELIVLGLFLKLKGFRVIYDVHEDSPREAISLNKNRPVFGFVKFCVWHVLEFLAKQFLDAFVCVTPPIAAKFPPRKTYLVRNFPRLDKVALPKGSVMMPYGKRENVAVYAGGITEIRGIAEMIDAITHTPPPLNAHLLLLGAFSPPSLESEMQQRPGWSQVDFLGWRSRESVVEQLGRSRVGLVTLLPEPIYLESLPVKLFEYMNAGLPVIASDFPLWRTLIEEIDCGLLVDPANPLEIADAMEYLFTHPDIAEAMGKRGQAAVQNTYNWNSEAQTLLTLYQTLAPLPEFSPEGGVV